MTKPTNYYRPKTLTEAIALTQQPDSVVLAGGTLTLRGVSLPYYDTVIDVQEMNSEAEIPVQLLIYQYDVAGVQYECSQDVTWLRQFVDMHSCRLGLPASIKYDPHNPGNSIVIAEDWSGLRR